MILATPLSHISYLQSTFVQTTPGKLTRPRQKKRLVQIYLLPLSRLQYQNRRQTALAHLKLLVLNWICRIYEDRKAFLNSIIEDPLLGFASRSQQYGDAE